MSGDAYYIKKHGSYYRPKAEGYTLNPWEAGVFTAEEVQSYTYPNGPHGPRDGISYIPVSAVPIGLGGWLQKVEVHQYGGDMKAPPGLEDWFHVTDTEVTIAIFRNMEDAFTFKLDYINGKLNK